MYQVYTSLGRKVGHEDQQGKSRLSEDVDVLKMRRKLDSSGCRGLSMKEEPETETVDSLPGPEIGRDAETGTNTVRPGRFAYSVHRARRRSL